MVILIRILFPMEKTLIYRQKMTRFLLLTEAFFSIENPTFLHANSILDRERLSVHGDGRIEDQRWGTNANRLPALHSVGCYRHPEWIWIHLLRCDENPPEPSGFNRHAGLPRKFDGSHGTIQSSIRWLTDATIPSVYEPEETACYCKIHRYSWLPSSRYASAFLQDGQSLSASPIGIQNRGCLLEQVERSAYRTMARTRFRRKESSPLSNEDSSRYKGECGSQLFLCATTNCVSNDDSPCRFVSRNRVSSSGKFLDQIGRAHV